MEYVSAIDSMSGLSRYSISSERGLLILAIAVVAIIMGLILMRSPK